MAKVRQQMAAAGCGMFSTSAQCTRLSRIASRMSANLNTLSARSGSGRSRNQLLADLNANDCRAVRRNPVTVAGEKAESVVTRLFGGRDGDRPAAPSRERNSASGGLFSFWRSDDDAPAPAARRSAGRDRVVQPVTAAPSPALGSGMRTFCVRTCDGYYFPMSPSSSRSDFARDEQNCQAACPGAEVSLYYHQDGQEDAEAMISRRTGKRYEALKTAFLYRTDSDAPQCGCRAAPGALKLPIQAQASEPSLPLPANRPDPAADPETLANAEGNLTAKAMRRMLTSEEDMDLDDRKVRVVGPVFLPDPASAAAAPSPDHPRVQ